MDHIFQQRNCKPCEKIGQTLSDKAIQAWLGSHPQWSLEDTRLRREITFSNYFETMAVVNAIAFVAHREDHHPDLQVGYNRLVVDLCTHALGGITENDLIVAECIESLIKGD